MIQPLWQQVTSSADATGRVTLSFPPVPQGLVWWGSIRLYSPLPAGSHAGTLQPGIWNLTRSGNPVLSFAGDAGVSDIMAVSQEVLTISGQNLKTGTPVYAVWNGWSGDPTEAPLLYPKTFGQQINAVQVYTDPVAGAGSALSVAPTPTPANLQFVKVFASAAGTVTMIPASVSGYSLWTVSLNVSASNSGTAAIDAPLLVSVLNGSSNLLTLEPIAVQASAVSVSQSIECYGLHLPPSTALTLSVGSYSGTALRVNATAIFGDSL